MQFNCRLKMPGNLSAGWYSWSNSTQRQNLPRIDRHKVQSETRVLVFGSIVTRIDSDESNLWFD